MRDLWTLWTKEKDIKLILRSVDSRKKTANFFSILWTLWTLENRHVEIYNLWTLLTLKKAPNVFQAC